VQYVRQLWKFLSAKNSCHRMSFTLSAYIVVKGWVYRDKKLAAAKGLVESIWFDVVVGVNAGGCAANWRVNRVFTYAIL
ncbi:lytic transglycosylase domain-containing protein, partial [Salmonella enterica subsp. enterica serovar Infantis]